jgi:hypothetical protein
MYQPLSPTSSSLNLPELQSVLEPLIRHVVQEELKKLVTLPVPVRTLSFNTSIRNGKTKSFKVREIDLGEDISLRREALYDQEICD